METLAFETSLGYTTLARTGRRIHALTFGHASERSALKALARTLSAKANGKQTPYALQEVESLSAGDDEFVDQLYAFATGEVTRFDGFEVDTSHLTEFGKKVTAACRRIAWGQTLTYGELAKRAGRPGAARAVGSVMSRNRVPLIVPCHRVVPAGKGLGGFSSPQGVAMKQRLLELEQQGSLQVAQRC